MRLVIGSTRAHAGFSLLEVIVVMAVLAAIISFGMPTLTAMVESNNALETQQQAEEIWRAIYGDPSKGEFGYLGDMGRLPTSLTELVDRAATNQLAFHTHDGATEHLGRIGTGWRGPYLSGLFSNSDLLTDAWGRPFTFSNAQVTSGGPDGDSATTGDNIVFPVHQPSTTGTMFVTVLANRIPNPLGATTKLYSTVNGELTATTTKKHLPADATFDGFFYENLTPGLHVLRAAHTGRIGDNGACVTITRYVPVAVHAGRQVIREIRMINAADVKITDNDCTIPD